MAIRIFGLLPESCKSRQPRAGGGPGPCPIARVDSPITEPSPARIGSRSIAQRIRDTA